MRNSSERGVRYFAQHFVSLSWVDRTPGARARANGGRGEPFSASGFVVAAKDEWFLVTAGHVLSDIEKALANGQQLEDWQLDDGWSLERKTDVPLAFNLADTPRFHFKNDFDYGVIYLHPLFRRNLESNRVVPVDIRQWTPHSPVDFDSYILLGLPSELRGELADEGFVQSLVTWGGFGGRTSGSS